MSDMASVEDCKRHSPVGEEFEPEEKELEGFTKYFVEAFRTILMKDVDYQQLLMHYPFFSPEQRKELNRMGKNCKGPEVISTGLEMIDSLENQPKKYRRLVEALQEAGYDKIVRILTGEIIPVNEKNRDSINKNFRFICENVDPLEILPTLIKHKVIGEIESQLVRQVSANQGAIRAMLELLLIIHTKQQHWFQIFMEALIDARSDHVAKKIDRKLYKEIREIRENGISIQCLADGYTSCIPVNNNQPKKGEKPTGQVSSSSYSSGTIEHVIKDSHEPSMQANNLSAPDQLAGELLSNTLDFQEILSDNDNIRQESAYQSVSDRQDYSETSVQKTNLKMNVDNVGNQPESLSFDSLLVDNSVHHSRSSNSQMSSNQESLPNQRLNSFTRELGDGGTTLSTTNFESNGSFFQTASEESSEAAFGRLNVADDEQTLLKAVSIESNDRVPQTVTSTGAANQTRQQVTQIYSRTLRDNSQSPDLKVMRDKNVDAISGSVTMNINSKDQELESSSDVKEVEDTDISLRGYQHELAEPALHGKNVIIVAPTGSGKTRVALSIIQEHIRKKQGHSVPKVIFLVNQVALAKQQGDECGKQLKCYSSKVISGETQRGRKEYLKDFIDKRDILIVTAQVLLDSLVRNEIQGIHMFSLMVFDECHHTHANHTFNQIMSMYMTLKFSKNPPVLPQIVGLTASVGVGKARDVDKAVEHIKKLMANLDAEIICTVQQNIQELRSYVALPDEETYTVSKRENDIFGESVKKLMYTIEQLMTMSSVVKEMAEAKQFEKVMKPPAGKGTAQYTQWVSKLWKESAKLQSAEARRFVYPCRIHLEHYNNALIIHNDARVQDALSYLDREMKIWRDQAKNMDQNEKKLDNAFKKLRGFKFDQCSDNPKLQKLCEMIIKAYRTNPENSRGIVFVRTRELAKAVCSWMKETDGLKELNPIPFLGQHPHADKGGMTKAEQDDVLKYFKDGKHKLIIATSVAEEGLDISKCNLVIRYDHVSNEIAMVQSRGRGRAKDSNYYVIAEEGTGVAEKEELNMIREIMMRKAIKKLQEEIHVQPKKFKKDLHELQDEANLHHQLKSHRTRRLLPRAGNFELQCQKCSQFICMSKDLKKIKDAHHVIVDEQLEERVDFVKTEIEECAVEANQPIGRLSCKCGEKLGVISIYHGLEFPVPKIEKFLIVDHNGRQITKKRWKDVPLMVVELNNDDFRNILETRKQNGSLDEDLG